MQNFGYCIWLLPEKNSELYNLTKGFNPHISLATKMDLDCCLSKFKGLSKKEINVKIIDKPICTVENDFHALQFNVSIIDSFIPLNPIDPHISLIYKYNEKITKNEINKLLKKIDFSKLYKFNIYDIMKCDNHYKNWHKI